MLVWKLSSWELYFVLYNFSSFLHISSRLNIGRVWHAKGFYASQRKNMILKKFINYMFLSSYELRYGSHNSDIVDFSAATTKQSSMLSLHGCETINLFHGEVFRKFSLHHMMLKQSRTGTPLFFVFTNHFPSYNCGPCSFANHFHLTFC